MQFLREVPQVGQAAYTAQPVKLAWGLKVDAVFIDQIFELCEDFGWSLEQANHLMACMAFESGRTFSLRSQTLQDLVRLA